MFFIGFIEEQLFQGSYSAIPHVFPFSWIVYPFVLNLVSDMTGVWRRRWHPTPVLLPRKSHGRRNLVDCSPWSREESDTTERLHFHFSRTGEGNGNPFQCSCLENPRMGEPGGLAVYGVAQSRTQLKRLSSSSSSSSSSSIETRLLHSWILLLVSTYTKMKMTIKVFCVHEKNSNGDRF